MRARLLRLALAALLLIGLAGLASGPAYAAPPAPAIAPSTSSAAPGDEITVALSGWTPSIVVSVAVCGTAGQSLACATDTAGQVVPDASGVSTAQLIVSAPPAQCPCVLQALSVDGGAVSVPFEVAGVPVAAPTPEDSTPAEQPELDGTITLTGESSWGEQLGLGGTRTFVVAVTNVSGVPTEEGDLSVVLGRNTRSGDVAASFDIPALPPGESFEVTGDLAIPAGTTGAYVAYVVGPGSIDAVAFTTFESWAVLGAVAIGMLFAFGWALAGVRGPAQRPRSVRFLERIGLALVVVTVVIGLAAIYVTM